MDGNEMPCFGWEKKRTQQNQADGSGGYKQYITDHLVPTVDDAELHAAFDLSYSIVDRRLPFDMRCEADAAIRVKTSDIVPTSIAQILGLHFVIRVSMLLGDEKEDEELFYDPSIVAELVGLNLKAPENRVIMLHTNLEYQWHFYFVCADRAIGMLVLNEPDNALEFIQSNAGQLDMQVTIPFEARPTVYELGDLTMY